MAAASSVIKIAVPLEKNKFGTFKLTSLYTRLKAACQLHGGFAYLSEL